MLSVTRLMDQKPKGGGRGEGGEGGGGGGGGKYKRDFTVFVQVLSGIIMLCAMFKFS